MGHERWSQRLLCALALLVAWAPAATGQDEPPCSPGAWCGDGEGYWWPTKGGNVRRTGSVPFISADGVAQGYSWIWRNDSSIALFRASPVIDQDWNIYMTQATGIIMKFDKNGRILWEYHRQEHTPDTPVLSKGKLYSNSGDGSVFALDMQTGKEVWSSKVLNWVAPDSGSLAVCEGRVLSKAFKPGPLLGYSEAGEKGGASGIVAVNETNGDFLWSFATDSQMMAPAPVCAGDGTFIISDQDGTVYRASLRDAKLVWKQRARPTAFFKTDVTHGGAILGPDDIIYSTYNRLFRDTSSTVGFVRAMRLSDGRLTWEQRLGYPAFSMPAVGWTGDNLTVYVTLGKAVAAKADHSCIPTMDYPELRPAHCYAELGTPSDTAIAAFFAGTGEPALFYGMDTMVGPGKGEYNLQGMRRIFLGSMHMFCKPEALTPPAVGRDGTFYAGHNSGYLLLGRDFNQNRAIDRSDHMEAQAHDMQMAIASPPALAPGMLVVASCDELTVFLS